MRNRLATVLFGFVCVTLGILATAAARADELPGRREACVPGASGPPIGTVVALSGKAWAEAEHCDAALGRALGCGEAIYEGEHIVTDPGASIAFTIEQSEVHVAADSELSVALGRDGAADLTLLRGRARVFDPDGATGAGRRFASGSLVSIGRGDTEISATAGQAPIICEYAQPLAIGSSMLAPGNCTGPHFAARTADQLGVSLFDAGSCEVASDDAFDPFEVAGGPGLVPFPPPPVPPPPPPSCAFGTCTTSPPVNPPPPAPPPGLIESPGVDDPPPL